MKITAFPTKQNAHNPPSAHAGGGALLPASLSLCSRRPAGHHGNPHPTGQAGGCPALRYGDPTSQDKLGACCSWEVERPLEAAGWLENFLCREFLTPQQRLYTFLDTVSCWPIPYQILQYTALTNMRSNWLEDTDEFSSPLISIFSVFNWRITAVQQSEISYVYTSTPYLLSLPPTPIPTL